MTERNYGELTDSDGHVVERQSVIGWSGGANSSKGVPHQLTVMVETFGLGDAIAPLTTKYGILVAGAVYETGAAVIPGNFALALSSILGGRKCGRLDTTWKARHRFVYLVPGSEFQVSRAPLMGIYPSGHHVRYNPHLDVCYTDGTCGVWSLTQEDVMAEDWVLVDENGAPL